MDEADFRRQVSLAWKFFSSDLQLGRLLRWDLSLPINQEFRSVALSKESSYAEIYKKGLTLSHYNFILRDYSYFQLSWENSSSWRMAYMPNPWISGVSSALREISQWEALEEIGEIDSEEVSDLIEELPYVGSIPAIRFEYSEAQYREISHPVAHFHLGRDTENRWPCSIRLGPLSFCMLIAKLYYSTEWKAKSSYEEGQSHLEGCIETSFSRALEKNQAVHLFSISEKGTLHFGRNIPSLEEPRTPAKHSGSRNRQQRRRVDR